MARAIFVTEESASGRNLLRVILERRYGIRPEYVDEPSPFERALAGEPTLLIGDSAIDAMERFPETTVYDLGRLWHEWTRQQTVFAVWAARRDVYERNPAAVRRLHARADRFLHVVALARGRSRRARAARDSAPAGILRTYYGKLNFMLHVAAQNGLAAYCRELVAIGAIPELPSFPETARALAS